MNSLRNRSWWRWAILGAFFGLAGPAAGLARAIMDVNDVPLAYLLTDRGTLAIVFVSCTINAALLVLFVFTLNRVNMCGIRASFRQIHSRLLASTWG